VSESEPTSDLLLLEGTQVGLDEKGARGSVFEDLEHSGRRRRLELARLRASDINDVVCDYGAVLPA
jgi:hypothetical protein